jgi:hypothetical protein
MQGKWHLRRILDLGDSLDIQPLPCLALQHAL